MKIKGWLFVVLFACLAVWIVLPQHASAKDAAGKHVVVIDPSHGGKDGGVKLSGNVSEKDVTLAIATLIKRYLEDSKNLVVKFTRMGDTDVAMTDRVGAAIKANADLFISLHVNAGFEKDSAGYELYFPGFKGQEGAKGAPKAESAAIVRDMVRTKHLNDSVGLHRLLAEEAGPGVPADGQGPARRPSADSSEPQHSRGRPGNRILDKPGRPQKTSGRVDPGCRGKGRGGEHQGILPVGGKD